jgi:hypothetical protein
MRHRKLGNTSNPFVGGERFSRLDSAAGKALSACVISCGPAEDGPPDMMLPSYAAAMIDDCNDTPGLER